MFRIFRTRISPNDITQTPGGGPPGPLLLRKVSIDVTRPWRKTGPLSMFKLRVSHPHMPAAIGAEFVAAATESGLYGQIPVL